MERLVILSSLMFSIIMGHIKTETYSLTVKVAGLENSKGAMVFALYNKDGSIPDQKFRNYYRKQSTNIVKNKSEIKFINLPQGVYAVTVLHDENNDGKVDTKFMLPLPNEGVGFSNYEDFGLNNRPNFNNASFILNKDSKIVVKVIYK